MSHRFALGQAVTYFANRLEDGQVSGRYVITQLLPCERGEYHYNVRREKTGELRRARETQLRSLPPTPSIPNPPTRRSSRRTPTKSSSNTH